VKRTSIIKLVLAVAAVSVAVGVGASVASAHNAFCLGAACPASSPRGVVPTSALGNNHCPEGTAQEIDFAQNELLPSPGVTKAYSFGTLSGNVTVIVSNGHASFSITGGAVASQARTHGGNGQGGTNATNIYSYSAPTFPAGGVASDGELHFSGPQSNVFICLNDPLTFAVATHSFKAVRSGKAVTLRWRTAAEQDTLGFNVFRKAHGKLVKLNRRIIPAASLTSSSTSHAYSFRARLASRKLAASSRYVLAEVHPNGSRTLYGPIRASAAS